MRNRVSISLLSLSLITLALFWAVERSKLRPSEETHNVDARLRSGHAEHTLPSASHAQLSGLKDSHATQPGYTHPATSAASPQAAKQRTGKGTNALPIAPRSAASVKKRLEQAITLAQTKRSLTIDPSVVTTALEEGSVRVILSDTDDAELREFAGPLAGVSSGGGGEESDLRVFPLFGSAALRVVPETLIQLIEKTDTTRIEADRVHRPSLIDSVQLIETDLLHAADFDGDGFSVALLDTGIDRSHPLFAGRVVEEACFSSQGDCPNEERSMLGEGAAAPCALGGCGHGTHVAGILAAKDPESSLRGTAPHATIIAIQIFSEVEGDPGAYSSDILAGLQHVLALSDFHTIAAVNLSFGTGEFESHCDSSTALYNAVRRLREAGIASVAAAGNDARTDAISSPACLSNVIGVSSVNDNDSVSSFSNTSASLSMLAPGRSIRSSAVGGGLAYNSGTSMATPHVTGTIAALREAYPEASVSELENALTLSGLPISDDRNGLVFPRLRAEAARTLLAAVSEAPPEIVPPVSAPPEENTGTLSAARPKSGGGGGGCGLVGLEPFLILGLIRMPGAIRKRLSAA
ncbi:MAG: S8 family serine peptidase [Myxococcota bacterium]